MDGIVQGDTGDPAIRLDVNPGAPEFTDRNDEAVRIISDASGIRIIGKTPIATRHGAYILLEKLGVRWFFPHSAWEVVPSSIVDLGVIDEVHEPVYFWRSAGGGGVWGRRNRMYGTEFYWVSHSYKNLIAKTEWDTNRDWFLPELPPEATELGWPWQLNPYHPDVLTAAIAWARTQLSKPAQMWYSSILDDQVAGSVPISPNDGGGWTPPYSNTDYQTITDAAFYLANEVAKDIQVDFPGRYIGLYSYAHYSAIPSFDLEPNLLVEIATDFNFSGIPLDTRIQGIIARGAQAGIRDYLNVWSWWYDGHGLMADRLSALTSYANQGCRVYYGEGSYGWGGRGLTYYAASKMLWNPYADLNAIFDDFYTKAFGPAKVPMKRYYERYGTGKSSTTDGVLLQFFLDLQEAESLAAGNEKILERIRQLEYYQRYLWLWNWVPELTLDELKGFYTFVTRISDLEMITYDYLEENLRGKLKARGLTDADVIALRDFTPPTATEAAVWLNEAIAALQGTQVLQLVPLGDTTHPRLEPPNIRDNGNVLVPSGGNETVTVMVKGVYGSLRWYDPYDTLIDTFNFPLDTPLPDWTPVNFPADIAGIYRLNVPSNSSLCVDDELLVL